MKRKNGVFKEEEEEEKKKNSSGLFHTQRLINPTQPNLTNLSIYQQERDKSSTRRLSKIKIKKNGMYIINLTLSILVVP